MSVSFSLINVGGEYSRKFLAEIWGYDGYQAIARGVVTPKNDNKIILFVTAEKQESLEQYKDKLVGEYLHWEGPNDHFAEHRMIHSRSKGQDIHLFYRAIHHSNFIYFGKIDIINFETELKKPSRFVFHLTDYYRDSTEKVNSENWNRNQLLVIFNLYLKISSGELETGNIEIRELALLIGKYESSIAIKLNNFAYTDPYNQQHGLIGLDEGAVQVQPIWDEFVNNQEGLIFESEQVLADYQHKTLEEAHPEIDFQNIELKGEDKSRLVKTRINQGVFRKIILKSYHNKCAISGLNVPELLVAGHIVPWSINKEERLNPENGICLSHLYDRAYETGLICIDTDFKVLTSKRLKDCMSKDLFQRFFGVFENNTITVPKAYKPKKEFLDYRLNRFEL